MTIERLGNRQQIVCDNCDYAYPNTYACEDFDIMLSDARAAGWIVGKRAGQWTHTCPDHPSPRSKALLL